MSEESSVTPRRGLPVDGEPGAPTPRHAAAGQSVEAAAERSYEPERADLAEDLSPEALSDAEAEPDPVVGAEPPAASPAPATPDVGDTVLDLRGVANYVPPVRQAVRRSVPVPAPKKPRKRRPVMKVVGAMLALALVAVLGIGGYYVAALYGSVDKINRKDMMASQNNRPPVHGEPMNFVLLGVDTGVYRDNGEESGNLSDTLMVVHLSGDRQKVYVTSIPRDTYVKIRGHGHDKINEAFKRGGPALSVTTVEDLLDIKIDHVATITLGEFPRLVDTLGGVTVQNHHASETGDRKYFFPEGECRLEDGLKAMAFVRQRYELPNGDLDRAKRQRAFMSALIGKAASPETLSNPARVSELMNKGAKLITVDSGFSSNSIRSLAMDMRINSSEDVRQLAFPLYGYDNDSGAGAVNVVDRRKLTDLRQAFKDEKLEDYYQAHKNDEPLTEQESHFEKQYGLSEDEDPDATPTPVLPPTLKAVGGGRPTATTTRRR